MRQQPIPNSQTKNSERNLKILIVGINFYPELTGIGKYTGEMAEFLSQNGHQVHVITTPPYYPYWKVQPGYHGWQYKKESCQGAQIFRCPVWVPGKLSGFKRLLHLSSFTVSSLPILLWHVFWHADLVLCMAPSLMNAPFALMTARMSKAKAWLHIQDFELEAAQNFGMLSSKSFFSKIANRSERFLLTHFDQVSTISNRMVERLIKKGVIPEKTYLFPNWIDPEVIYPSYDKQNKLRKNLKISNNKIVVLYSGSMGYKQGLEIVVQAAKQLIDNTQILFVLCGEGATRQNLINSSKNLPNVLFLPLQPLDKFNALLNMADIHILPQSSDAEDLVMPSKLSGMLASGKVVIVTANPGTELAQVIEQLGIVLPPENSSALVQAILHLAANSELRKKLGKKGYTWVIENWSKKVVLNKFFAHIE